MGHVAHSLCALAVFCWRFEKHVGLVQCTWCTIKCRVDGVHPRGDGVHRALPHGPGYIAEQACFCGAPYLPHRKAVVPVGLRFCAWTA